MTVELLFGIALGYVPCKHLYLVPAERLADSHTNKDVDNFGSCTTLKIYPHVLIFR